MRESSVMNGPFWNDTTGVTGEPNFRDNPDGNYETVMVEGKPKTRLKGCVRTEEEDLD